MTTIFWDVDTQHDFIQPDGRLYVAGSEEIVPVLRALSDYAHANDIRIIASADDHVEDHPELSETPDFRETFPPHCMRGTPGQRKIPETTLRDPIVIELLDPSQIVLYGVALDVCDRFAVEGLLRHRPASRLHVVTDATRPIDPAAGEALLRDWHHRGVALVSSRDVLEGRVV